MISRDRKVARDGPTRCRHDETMERTAISEHNGCYLTKLAQNEEDLKQYLNRVFRNKEEQH